MWRKWTADLPRCPWCGRRAGDMHACYNEPCLHWRTPRPPVADHGDYPWFCGRCATRVRDLDPAWEDEWANLCPVCAGRRTPEDAPRREGEAAILMQPPSGDTPIPALAYNAVTNTLTVDAAADLDAANDADPRP